METDPDTSGIPLGWRGEERAEEEEWEEDKSKLPPSTTAEADVASGSSDEEIVEGADGLPRGGSKAYTKKAYWDKRFESEEHHEWLAAYKDIREIVNTLLPSKDVKMLLVGCGTSTLAADLADDGYTDILSTDYSETVIERMRDRYARTHPQIRWEVQDMLALTYPDAAFDVVFDKAAMDAVLAHGGDVWDPPAKLLTMTDTICAETARVLKDGGLYLQLTFSQPHFRKRYLLQQYESRWDTCRVHDVPVGFGYFLFALTRKGR